MKTIKNNKGMTLIEILVVLLLSSIVMVIVGNILLTSIGFFQTTSDENIDKQSVDAIADNVRRELTYASEVLVDLESNPPTGNDWHKISLNDEHQLLFDDALAFTSGYYGFRTLKLEARNDSDVARIDLRFGFYDIDSILQYETKSSLYLVNKAKSIASDAVASNDGYTEISKTTGYVIYYKNGNYEVTDSNPPEITPTPGEAGTVADQEGCISDTVSSPGKFNGNNKGLWVSGTMYYKGQFVQYPANGLWYRLTVDYYNAGIPPNTTWEWKLISAFFDGTSNYEYGDIVIYNNKYYQVITKEGSGRFVPTVEARWFGPKDSPHDLIEATKIQPEYSVCLPDKRCSGTVTDEYHELDETNAKGDWYKNMPGIKVGDFVRYSGEGDDGKVYWYRALFSGLLGDIPGSKSVNTGGSWKRIVAVEDAGRGTIANYFHDSPYKQGDIIYYPANSKYYKATPLNAGSMQIIWHYDPVSYPRYWTEVEPPSSVCPN